jgi:hypothetical protein
MKIKYNEKKVLRFYIYTDDGYYGYEVWLDVVKGMTRLVLGDEHWKVVEFSIDDEFNGITSR